MEAGADCVLYLVVCLVVCKAISSQYHVPIPWNIASLSAAAMPST